MAVVYRNTGPTPWVDVPNYDLLTLVFDSAYAPFEDSTLLHVDAKDETNSLTKGQLSVLARRIAHGLRSNYGIGANGPGKDVVTVISYGQILVPALFYGIIAAGGVYSAASPHSTVSELARQITTGTSNLVVCSNEFIDLVRKTAPECNLPLRNVLVLESTPNAWSLRSLSDNINCISPQLLDWQRITDPQQLKDSLIVILWSSGTTGLPKGVMLSHLNLVCETYITALSGREWAAKQIEQGNPPPPYRTLAHLPISHIAGLFGYLIGPQYGGGLVVWMRKYHWTEFYTSVSRFQITALYTVPSIFLRISKSPEVKDHFASVETAITGAAPMDEVLQKAANEKLGRKVGGKGREETYIGQTWGLSETTGAVTAIPKGEVDESGCIGYVLPNVEVRQIDPDTLTDTPPGEPGHMIVRSPLVTNGYFNNPTATAESFIDLSSNDPPDSPLQNQPWFLTGDIAVHRAGKFYIVDRLKELLKYKGQQVAPAELENVLASHPGVAEAAVVGVPGTDEARGEVGSDLPRAYVVRRPVGGDGALLTEEAVQEWLKTKVAPYKQLRGGVVFVQEIPKNAIGKYLRRELRERAKREVGGTGASGVGKARL